MQLYDLDLTVTSEPVNLTEKGKDRGACVLVNSSDAFIRVEHDGRYSAGTITEMPAFQSRTLRSLDGVQVRLCGGPERKATVYGLFMQPCPVKNKGGRPKKGESNG